MLVSPKEKSRAGSASREKKKFQGNTFIFLTACKPRFSSLIFRRKKQNFGKRPNCLQNTSKNDFVLLSNTSDKPNVISFISSFISFMQFSLTQSCFVFTASGEISPIDRSFINCNKVFNKDLLREILRRLRFKTANCSARCHFKPMRQFNSIV